MSANDKVYNAIVQRQIWLERYKNGVIHQMGPVLKAAIRDMKSRIASLPENASRMQLEMALQEVTAINRKMSTNLYDQVLTEMKQLSAIDMAFTAAALQAAIPSELSIKIGLPSKDFLARAVQTEPFQGLTLNQWMGQLSDAANLRARRQLFTGMAEGDSVPRLAQRMAAVGDSVINDASMIARTATSFVTNTARNSVYDENSDVVQEVMWRSVLDSRTSEICQSRDGMTWKLDSNYPSPPAHPNCRSVLVPVIVPLSSLGIDPSSVSEGTRASMDGQVPSSETYQSWLTKQPAAFQDEVLGPARGDAFRNGGLTLNKFVDDSGKRLTLKQLETKYPSAF